MTPLEFTDEEFQQVLHKAQAFYADADHVYCPYFRQHIQLNTQGLEHLRHRTWNRGRKRRDQFMRLKHLPIAPDILRLSHTVQGIRTMRSSGPQPAPVGKCAAHSPVISTPIIAKSPDSSSKISGHPWSAGVRAPSACGSGPSRLRIMPTCNYCGIPSQILFQVVSILCPQRKYRNRSRRRWRVSCARSVPSTGCH